MAEGLAIHGGPPVRETMLPCGHQWVDEDDVQAVAEVLRSNWLTTGPKVDEFERAFADCVNAREAVAVSNGTAALHAAMFALGIGQGEEVIVPAITFVATANCVVYRGGSPVFADVHPDTLLLDPAQAASKITSRTKAIIAVDYAGQPCDYDALREIADRHELALVADACHSLGASYNGRSVGSLADLNIFSFHPVKAITSGEGGMVTTDDKTLAQQVRIFRHHGITTDHKQRAEKDSFFYEMADLGYNCRLSDLQCALGLSQLRKLPEFVRRRREIAALYDEGLADTPAVCPIAVRSEVSHAYHLYVLQWNLNRLRVDRTEVFAALRAENIGVNVHYMPVYKHPYYHRIGYEMEFCATAERAYAGLISLPIFLHMTDQDVADVLTAVTKVANYFHV
ncbi:MAG TPA: UDP-4-amino-4,6-dideoxy-N-acetyl-beta-L-altrosamine transaminase [Desulfobacterales bacterium]|nr:UDP-4-amino-4,6-dideoxy-N-acetyl-beta-L-altrosamine transaminase [Desulfobacterales bacterium]